MIKKDILIYNFSGNTDDLELIDQCVLPLRSKYIRLKQLLDRWCKEITADDILQFPSLFSRLVYISQKLNLPRKLEWQLQNIRVKTSFLLQNDKNIISAQEYSQAYKALESFLSCVNGRVISITTSEDNYVNNIASKLPSDNIRVQIINIDTEKKTLVCRANDLIEEYIHVRYNVPFVNDIFTDTIDILWIGAQLNLIEVKISDDGFYIPTNFILEPDYLIDASAIAECFQNFSTSYLHYFRRKFEQPAVSLHILLGNLSNFFLDELIYTDDIENIAFEEVFKKSFRTMPFEYASCTEIQNKGIFIDFMGKAKTQFENIRRVIRHDLSVNGFDITECVLEPSFLCEKFGFQGRLDLLQPETNDSDLYRIIELKSGKPPYPADDLNRIGINHEVQTTVYRLMIESVFNKTARQIYPTILYSSVSQIGANLRLAAPFKKLEKEILNIRNKIVLTEHKLYTGDNDTLNNLFNELYDTDSYGKIPDFFANKLNELKKVFLQTSSIEKNYIYRYITFISRELYIQKAGDEGFNTNISVSSLWNTDYEERKQSLDLIDGLEIIAIDNNGRDMKVTFSRQPASDCVNFREGEICILYPRQHESESMLTNQILKGNIVEIKSDKVILRFRHKQRNTSFFSKYKYWVIEHDKLDNSYNSMFKGLFSFLTSPKYRRDLLLGLRSPLSNYASTDRAVHSSTVQQKKNEVIDKALASKDYFLIVGPPGTGKTSIFIRTLIERLHADPDTNILVMAYTNRAVDELCESICAAFNTDKGSCDKYIRIGTELSCDEAFRHRLLQIISQDVKSRKELTDIIQEKRIFVGTLASIVGKPELFNIKKFDIAIIDEASQILEPQIIGLLPRFKRFIMIGDHKQLSTITLQGSEKSKVNNKELNDIGLYDCRESLFERLFRICQKNEWLHAYDTLIYHGRMHEELAAFVNHNFYDNKLQIATPRQSAPLNYETYATDNQLQKLIATHRLAFIGSECTQDDDLTGKTNECEANIITDLVANTIALFKANGMNFDPQKSIGIIAPYRNQIAMIKQKLEMAGIEHVKDIMIDTVERFQGSQRDIIFISFCFNNLYQLKNFINPDRDALVDRKLNVALTRAREQLFMVGNERILRSNKLYNELLNYTEVIHI